MNHPTVHSGEVSGGALAVTVGVSDMWQVIGDTQHVRCAQVEKFSDSHVCETFLHPIKNRACPATAAAAVSRLWWIYQKFKALAESQWDLGRRPIRPWPKAQSPPQELEVSPRSVLYLLVCQHYADLGLQPSGHVMFDEGGSMEVGSINYLQ